jgi:hypothetical protein
MDGVVDALKAAAGSQLLGVLVGAWLTWYGTSRAERRSRRRAARQAAAVVYDEMRLLAPPLKSLTRQACLDSEADEFKARLERSAAVWRDCRQQLVPDEFYAFEAIGSAFRQLQELSTALRAEREFLPPKYRAETAQRAAEALALASDAAGRVARRTTRRQADLVSAPARSSPASVPPKMP